MKGNASVHPRPVELTAPAVRNVAEAMSVSGRATKSVIAAEAPPETNLGVQSMESITAPVSGLDRKDLALPLPSAAAAGVAAAPHQLPKKKQNGGQKGADDCLAGRQLAFILRFNPVRPHGE